MKVVVVDIWEYEFTQPLFLGKLSFKIHKFAISVSESALSLNLSFLVKLCSFHCKPNLLLLLNELVCSIVKIVCMTVSLVAGLEGSATLEDVNYLIYD